MDRWTDGGDCNIPDTFLKKCGDNQQITTVAASKEIVKPECETLLFITYK